MCDLVFSPRRSAPVFYLGDFPARAASLKTRGEHKTGAGRMHGDTLTDVDRGLLVEMVRTSMARRAGPPSPSGDRAALKS
jgi:hypothetical protein